MTGSAPVCVVGQRLLASLRLKPGDTLQVFGAGAYESLRFEFIYAHKSAYPESELSDDDIAALYRDEIRSALEEGAAEYVIAAAVTSPSGQYDDTVFTPGAPDDGALFGGGESLDLAEYTAADNFRLEEFRDYAAALIEGHADGGLAFYMDTGKVDNVLNTIRLLDIFYPIAVSAALLIGGFLCVLLILQSSKDAAMMRVLGTTNRKTRVILALEQVLASIAGLLVGAGGLLIYKGSGLEDVSGQIALFAGLYVAVIALAAAVSAALATRKNVLELLQTKE